MGVKSRAPKPLHFWYGLSLKHKIFGAFATTIVVFSSASFWGLRNSHKLLDSIAEFGEYSLAGTRAALEVSIEISAMRNEMEEAINFPEAKSLSAHIAASERHERLLRRELDLIEERHPGENEKKLIGEIERIFREWTQTHDRLFERLAAMAPGDEIRKLGLEDSRQAHRLSLEMRHIQDHAKNEARRIIEEGVDDAARVARVLFFVVSLSLLLGIAFSYFFARFISGRLTRLGRSAERISRGDFNHRIEVVGSDELGELAGSFNLMADRLSELHGSLENRIGARTRELVDIADALKAEVRQRRAAEDELKDNQAMLVQSQKLEAVGQLAGGVAHDFNNLLTIMEGSLHFLLAENGTAEERREDLLEIKKAADRAAGLTRQLLAFSRKQIMKPKVVDLNAVARDMDKIFRRTIGEDIELVMELDDSLGKVMADPGQIENILINMVVNARDAMPRGGKLIIETENQKFDCEVVMGGFVIPPGEYCMLVVSDSGVGMDKETLAKIFLPFFTTKEKGKGTGLGLSTVFGIVKQSGGFISAYSNPGRGTAFKVYLPRVEAPFAPEGSPAGMIEYSGKGETVLVVEDEGAVRKMMGRVLLQFDYKVLDAAGGEEALDLVKGSKEPISLLVTDVVMPKMDGMAVAERVQALIPGIPVLFVSGYTDEVLARSGVLREGLVLLNKPFSAREFVVKIREMIDGRKV